ncbi:MAG: glycosyltransferase family 2 protein [Chloroflexota bacterium]
MAHFLNRDNLSMDEWVARGLVLAVIVPCYNVEQHIAAVVASIPGYVRHIVLVNDASPDATGEILQGLADPRLALVHHEENQGVGGAMLSGYRLACELGADIAVKMDGDGQMDAAYIPALVEPIVTGQANYTKGNRFLHEQELRTMPWQRRLGNVGLSFLTKLASGYWNIFDPTNGFTALDLSIFPLLDLKRIDRRYFFETSFLFELGLQRAVVQDVSIPARYQDETSFLSEWHSLVEFPPKILRGLLRRILLVHFLRDFNAVSLFLIAGLVASTFGLAWGSYHWWHSALENRFASTGTIMVAVLPLIVGIQLLLQAVVMDTQNIPNKPIRGDRP